MFKQEVLRGRHLCKHPKEVKKETGRTQRVPEAEIQLQEYPCKSCKVIQTTYFLVKF